MPLLALQLVLQGREPVHHLVQSFTERLMHFSSNLLLPLLEGVALGIGDGVGAVALCFIGGNAGAVGMLQHFFGGGAGALVVLQGLAQRIFGYDVGSVVLQSFAQCITKRKTLQSWRKRLKHLGLDLNQHNLFLGGKARCARWLFH
mmetsp:Transcript_27764/g.64744  ORF Transcript_27764/g.64744 Transcript_27764/m.64744 type:complete len:146 (-) Transcript_27764:111-548(-)